MRWGAVVSGSGSLSDYLLSYSHTNYTVRTQADIVTSFERSPNRLASKLNGFTVPLPSMYFTCTCASLSF